MSPMKADPLAGASPAATHAAQGRSHDGALGVRSMRRELICLEPASPPRLQVRNGELPLPGRDQVLVRVEASSVNPIDARRAGGYGQRLLGLKGAAKFPLVLGNFDKLGWVRGALASARDKKAVRTAVQQRSPHARYAWTIFKPDPEALAALEIGVRERRLSLPVGLQVPLEKAAAAFAHLAAGKPGRAVLLP